MKLALRGRVQFDKDRFGGIKRAKSLFRVVAVLVLLCQWGPTLLQPNTVAQGSAGLMATLPRWQPGWSKWARDPSVVTMRVQVAVKADTDAFTCQDALLRQG